MANISVSEEYRIQLSARLVRYLFKGYGITMEDYEKITIPARSILPPLEWNGAWFLKKEK